MDVFLSNAVLGSCVLAWVLAQSSKLIIVLVRDRAFRLSSMISPGGMPSAHSAVVVALATRVGMADGLGSVAFAMAIVFAAVVMYDAAGVRRAVSLQARLLNRMLEEMIEGQRLNEDRLRELIGHTPFEVFVGALLGALVAIS